MSKKIKSFYVEVNGIRYKRVISTIPFPMGCLDCDLDGLCGTWDMGVPCSGHGDCFKKV